jgi:hypothetical protein
MSDEVGGVELSVLPVSKATPLSMLAGVIDVELASMGAHPALSDAYLASRTGSVWKLELTLAFANAHSSRDSRVLPDMIKQSFRIELAHVYQVLPPMSDGVLLFENFGERNRKRREGFIYMTGVQKSGLTNEVHAVLIYITDGLALRSLAYQST